MKNKTKKILAGLGLGLVGMGCMTGCNKDNDLQLTYNLTVINDSQYGIISPVFNNETNSVTVDKGDDYTFTISPIDGYEIDNLIIDGGLVEPQSIYTFTDIESDHSIGAVYSQIKYDDKELIKSLDIVGFEAVISAPYGIGEDKMTDAVAFIRIWHDKMLESGIRMENDIVEVCKQEITMLYFFEEDNGLLKDNPTEMKLAYQLNSLESICFNGDDVVKISFQGWLSGTEIKIERNNLNFVGNAYYDVYCYEAQETPIVMSVSDWGEGEDSVPLKLSELKLYFKVNY